MKWVIDSTGRFTWRPYYDQAELDAECEKLVSQFLISKNGKITFPISTDDLAVMIERDVSDLDLYADLSILGSDVEGITDFFPDKKPAVKIARELSANRSRENRLRTTLAHEYGHVKFHAFLWEYNRIEYPQPQIAWKPGVRHYKPAELSRKFANRSTSAKPGTALHDNSRKLVSGGIEGSCFHCRQGSIFDAPLEDWMEWQAAYVGGAILMPLTVLRDLFSNSVESRGTRSWLPAGGDEARRFTDRVAEFFSVSLEAAETRLLKLGVLQSCSTM